MAGKIHLIEELNLCIVRARFVPLSLLFLLQLFQRSSAGSQLLFWLTSSPALENILSQGTDDAGVPHSTINVKDGQEVKIHATQHFCYINLVSDPGWKETWMRIQVQVWSSKELKVTAVDEEKLEDLEYFSVSDLVQYFIQAQTNETTVSASLFSPKTCFRVDPSDSKTLYTVKPSRKFDICLFLVFLAGVLLFFFADMLSRSQLFYYSAGISTGLIASLFILIFVLGRFMPKKTSFSILMVGGWSFALYIIQLVCKNLQVILKEHCHLAVAYVAVVGFVSFAVCYHRGPLVEERTINILSWTLQLFGMLLIYAGIHIQQVALVIILAAFCSKNLEYPVTMAFTLYQKLKPWPCCRPEPRRLLRKKEYYQQAEEETAKALDELRKYCSNPDFSTLKMVSGLHSPKRFVDFIEGSSHLTSNEVSDHSHEYGLGGSCFEDDLFATDEEGEEEGRDTEKDKPNISSSENSTLRKS